MLKANVSNIKSYAEQLSKLLSLYENNTMSIMREILNVDTLWLDDNSESFFLKLNKPKRELSEFLEKLNDIQEKYEQVVKKIRDIESSINDLYFNQSYKNTIIQAYNRNIDNLRSIKSNLDSQSISFCNSYEQNLVREAVNFLNNSISILGNSRNIIERLFIKLSTVESEINAMLMKIEMNLLTEVDFSQYIHGAKVHGSVNVSQHYVYREKIVKSISIIDEIQSNNKSVENKITDSLFNLQRNIQINGKEINNKKEQVEKNIGLLNKNINGCKNSFNAVINRYINSVTSAVKNIETKKGG